MPVCHERELHNKRTCKQAIYKGKSRKESLSYEIDVLVMLESRCL